MSNPVCRIPKEWDNDIKKIQAEFKCSFAAACRIWRKRGNKQWVDY